MQDLLEYLSQKIRHAESMPERSQYRYDLVKALIKSYPPGTPIRPRELSVALGYAPSASSVFTVINTLLKRGEISRRRSGGRAYTYTVLKPGNTYDEERGAEPAKPTPEELTKEGYVNPSQVYAQRLRRARESELLNNELEGASVEKTYTFEELEELAMKYQFYNFGISMTAAQFLEKLKEE